MNSKSKDLDIPFEKSNDDFQHKGIEMGSLMTVLAPVYLGHDKPCKLCDSTRSIASERAIAYRLLPIMIVQPFYSQKYISTYQVFQAEQLSKQKTMRVEKGQTFFSPLFHSHDIKHVMSWTCTRSQRPMVDHPRPPFQYNRGLIQEPSFCL